MCDFLDTLGLRLPALVALRDCARFSGAFYGLTTVHAAAPRLQHAGAIDRSQRELEKAAFRDERFFLRRHDPVMLEQPSRHSRTVIVRALLLPAEEIDACRAATRELRRISSVPGHVAAFAFLSDAAEALRCFRSYAARPLVDDGGVYERMQPDSCFLLSSLCRARQHACTKGTGALVVARAVEYARRRGRDLCLLVVEHDEASGVCEASGVDRRAVHRQRKLHAYYEALGFGPACEFRPAHKNAAVVYRLLTRLC